jgi:AraC-like DNA-binding protein
MDTGATPIKCALAKSGLWIKLCGVNMKPVQKALWLIKSRSGEAISLSEITKGCRVSKFASSKAFVATTGFSVMDYVRRRRLTESARQLADGAPDILSVALDAGYSSHADGSDIPAEFTTIRIAARKYLVFEHRGHVSTIRATVATIWNKYLPEARVKVVQAPDFERYDDQFDPATGSGVVEIWIPIE